MTDNQADGFKDELDETIPSTIPVDEDPIQRIITEVASLCPCCGSEGARRWQLPSGGQWVCSECWSDFQDIPSLLREPPISPAFRPIHPRRAKSSTVTTPTTRNPASARLVRPLGCRGEGGSRFLAQRHPGYSCRQPVDPARTLAERARLNGTDQLAVGHNSCCILCGHIFYGAKLKQCTRCGGAVRIRTDHDLGLMTRNPSRFIEGD